MKRTSHLILALATLLLGTTASAATPLTDTSRLYLRLSADELATSLDGEGRPLRGTNPYSVKSRDTTEVWVSDPNPLLFKYEVSVALTDTEDQKAAAAFAKQLLVLIGRFPASAGATDVDDSVVEGLRLLEFKTALKAVAENEALFGGWIEQSLRLDSAKKMKEELTKREISTTTETVEAGYAKLAGIWAKCLDGRDLMTDDGQQVSCDAPFDVRPLVHLRRAQLALTSSLEFSDQAKTARSRAQTRLKSAEAAEAAARADLAKATDTTRPALERQLSDQEAEVRSATSALADATTEADLRQKAADQLRRTVQNMKDVDVPRALQSAAGGGTIRAFVNAVMAAENHVLTLVQTSRSFLKDAVAVYVPRRLETRGYSLQRQTLTVAVKPETKYEAFLPAAAKTARANGIRTVSIELEPHRAVSFRPGVAFVLGLLRNPTFSTVKEGDAYRIVQTDSRLTRYNVAAMLNLVPRGWDEPTFGGFFQVGVSPKSDETGFYFGAGITAESVFTFGAGVMLQQVRRLSPGLSVDRPIAKPEDLKVENPFKAALYVHATVTIGAK